MKLFKQNLLIFPLLALVLALFSNTVAEKTYRSEKGEVVFKSAAPLEIIQATSTKLMGLLNPEKKTFRFQVSMNTFTGFNSPKQEEHFNENYIESEVYPKAIFVGKIVEDIDMSVPGTYPIRAKGKLLLHGVEVPRTLKCNLIVDAQHMTIVSRFELALEDFGMKVPWVIENKLSNEIDIYVNIKMKAE